eukprot:CAMPEP_0170553612 /NCGR_PEP_ID=MMETSP0211-20121228/11448_1 /TAXON_ID=311385 /ORGANISM="Pseudokeronopsis sp., Strain OXSARD2" /LENGTH=420 /DNA_ID=CAMNT_0010862065 /DNA_START=505 /DNA_END=1764 /DNA_ORIENTATION=-
MREICLCLKHKIYLPNSFIIQKDEIGEEMYFIDEGKVSVLNADNQSVINVLEKGRFFGEIAIFLECKRIAYIRAETYCSIYVLMKKDIDRVLKSYPTVQMKFKEEAIRRNELTKNLAEKNKSEQRQSNITFANFLMHFTLRAKEMKETVSPAKSSSDEASTDKEERSYKKEQKKLSDIASDEDGEVQSQNYRDGNQIEVQNLEHFESSWHQKSVPNIQINEEEDSRVFSSEKIKEMEMELEVEEERKKKRDSLTRTGLEKKSFIKNKGIFTQLGTKEARDTPTLQKHFQNIQEVKPQKSQSPVTGKSETKIIYNVFLCMNPPPFNHDQIQAQAQQIQAQQIQAQQIQAQQIQAKRRRTNMSPSVGTRAKRKSSSNLPKVEAKRFSRKSMVLPNQNRFPQARVSLKEDVVANQNVMPGNAG